MTRKSTPYSIVVVLLVILPPILVAFAPIPKNPRCSATMMARLPKFLRWFGRDEKEEVEAPPPVITVGSVLPDVEVDTVLATTGQGDLVISSTPIKEVMGRGMSILVAMPAASTKSCASIHLPGYKEATASLLGLGVKKIVILLTSNKFVGQERTEDTYILTTSTSVIKDQIPERTALEQTESTPVTILIDDDNNLINQMGITKDMGFGVRTNRLVVILEDGIVQQVLREEGVKDGTATSATRLVEFLTPEEPPPEENPEAIEVDFRLIIAIGAILTIASYEGLAAFVVEQGWNIPFLPGFSQDTPTPVEEVFQLLKDHL